MIVTAFIKRLKENQSTRGIGLTLMGFGKFIPIREILQKITLEK